MKKVLVITGPTATGKTALGVELALRLRGEVISADSMQVYRGMDIGTAKVTAAEARGVPHHMVDVAEPWEPYSVSQWVEAAAACAEDILARGKLPVIVGGTGLYIDSLLSGRDFAEGGDPAVRAALGAEYDRAGGQAFREKLAAVDPARAAKLHPADKKRLVRAMEVYELTGETITAHDEKTKALPPRWDSFRAALAFADREALYARIDRRVDAMMQNGLIGEVQRLLDAGLPPGSTAMQAIGYKEVAAYLRGACTLAEAVEAVKRESRRYAKRQLTWLRRDGDLRWIEWQTEPDILRAADEISANWRK